MQLSVTTTFMNYILLPTIVCMVNLLHGANDHAYVNPLFLRSLSQEKVREIVPLYYYDQNV